MQISTSRSWLPRSSIIVAAFASALAPLSTVAQDAGAPAADGAALPPFLESALQGFELPARAAPAEHAFSGEMDPGVAKAINDALAAFRAKTRGMTTRERQWAS